ncbi:MAG: prepilin peptidase [Lacipirellulaceae bacterium]
MIDFLTACWFGVIGACVGSFLNVVAYRMPLGMSVIWKPSHCPKCKTQILARDNVPVLGWLWLKGKCRACSEPISPRYAIVEAVMGLTFFVLCYAEVFSGGANLPTGPLTEGRGALENVIEPNWTVLGVYGFHCAALCFLMCLLLIDLDGRPLTWQLFALFFAAVVFRYGWQFKFYETSNEKLSITAQALVGLAVIILGAFSQSRKQDFYSFLFAFLTPMLIFGKGCFTVWILAACFLLLFIRRNAEGKFFVRRGTITSIYDASILQIIFWKQLHALISS